MADLLQAVAVVVKKKRRRRRMINGVLCENRSTFEDDLIKDVGEDCNCKRFRCFEQTTAEERLRIFRGFRQLGSRQLQDLCLSELITAEEVKQRRSITKTENSVGKDEDTKRNEHSASYFYKLKVPTERGQSYRELPVCRVAFLSILGISRNRLRTTQIMLYNQQKRIAMDYGKQRATEEMLIPESLEILILSQINDYDELSETYSVKEMHKHFLINYQINVPYNSYWYVFHARFNIAKFQPKITACPTFDTFYETLHMFGLVDDFGSAVSCN